MMAMKNRAAAFAPVPWVEIVDATPKLLNSFLGIARHNSLIYTVFWRILQACGKSS